MANNVVAFKPQRAVSSDEAVKQFVRHQIQKKANARISATVLYQAYREWDRNRGGHPYLQKAFGMRMTLHGFRRSKGSHIYYLGITLKEV